MLGWIWSFLYKRSLSRGQGVACVIRNLNLLKVRSDLCWRCFLEEVSIYVGALGHKRQLTMWFMMKALGLMISALPMEGLQRGWRPRSAMCAVNHVSTIKNLDTKLGGASLASNIPCILSHIIVEKVKIVRDSMVRGQLKLHVWNLLGLCSWLISVCILYSFTVINHSRDYYSFQWVPLVNYGP